ncbi:MAG: ATP-dependent helicase [Bacteroidetes bacterium]|nr:ATP-dependent helicase [Bacteroidota bacterium]
MSSSEVSNAAFLSRYEKLNTAQKQAVDTIYGPVMVLAGPGTGKTEVLSMRIARLLLSEAQIQAQDILCLTYTDEATQSMRRRLLQIIGQDAHKVQINTFHGFCNSIIQSAPEYFSKQSLSPITDLEKAEMMRALLDDLPEKHPLRRLSGNVYYDSKRLLNLFDFMKQEAWSAEAISRAIDAHLAGLEANPAYRYLKSGKGYKKGDLKQAMVDEEKRRMELTRSAALLFDDYLRRMTDAGRYDYTDMILWVLQALREQPALLERYQERFQFILVDEFQDTNGAQSELLYTLTQFWEAPNMFVVGDDDQSIYEFQGARLRNIIEFYHRYEAEGVKMIVLKENYRSSQAILDRAAASIQNNLQRLIYQLKDLELDKIILSKNPRFSGPESFPKPVVRIYTNTLQEAAHVAEQIAMLQKSGTPLHEVAVLYAQHKQADLLISLLQRKGIPYNVKLPMDVLEMPVVQHILSLLRYLEGERRKPFSEEATLFELLHAPWYGIKPTDLAQIALYINSQPKSKQTRWRFVLGNALLLESSSRNLRSEEAPSGLCLDTPKPLQRVGTFLENALQQVSAWPLPLLLEKILKEAGIIDYVLRGKEYVWDIQALYSFFQFVRDYCTRNPRTKPADFLNMVQQMEEEGIKLPLEKVIQQDNGLRLLTAHGAKGSEFEHVFLIGCNANFWEKKQGNNAEFKLPPTVLATVEGEEKSGKEEVARRLFYVAMTRAKKHLYLSYNLLDAEGKERPHSRFIDEISTAEERETVSLSTDALTDAISLNLQSEDEVQIELVNQAWLERRLQSITMSYSHLSKFLKCPLSYYYENILKVPSLPTAALSFGIAVHYALEHLFDEMKNAGGIFPTKERFIQLFETRMGPERDHLSEPDFLRRMEQGRQVLDAYYEHNIGTWARQVLVEYTVPRFLLDGVPVTGKLDKLELDGNTCYVVDYKTGKPDGNNKDRLAAPSEKDPDGGDYWRQMVFYKLLLEKAPDSRWKVGGGRFEYVEKSQTTGEWKTVQIPVFAEDEQYVLRQLKTAYSQIMNHEFNSGCGEQDCHWCQFARKNERLRSGELEKKDDN